MVDPLSLTYKEKVLLYLKDYRYQEGREERPEDITQKGISQNVGISRTHVSRILGELSEEGLIEENLSSVKGHDRKLKTYILTRKGVNTSTKLLEDLSDKSIILKDHGEKKEVPITKIKDETDGRIDILRCLSCLESSDDLEIDLTRPSIHGPVKMIDDAPEFDEIYKREGELTQMKNWLESEEPVLAVLGRKGRGSSSVTSKFVKELKDRHCLWIPLKGTTEDMIYQKISDLLDDLGIEEKSLDKLRTQKALVVFDDYYEVKSDVVSFLKRLLDKIEKDDPLKVIITGRIGTPVYERFYQTEHVENGLVREMEIPPLDKEGAQMILGKEIKEDALKRIMMFTKGSPLLLKLLREGEKERLIELTPWEAEQISLLMYLKTETKDEQK